MSNTLKPVRTIEIIFDGTRGYTVKEGDRYLDELCWDEMLGTVAELTHPRIGEPRYMMKTAQGWQDWRERLSRKRF